MTTTGSRARRSRTPAAIQRFLVSDLAALLGEHAAADPTPARRFCAGNAEAARVVFGQGARSP
jgi:hypothetical protein